MLDFAFGELNLKPDEFWRLTWGEYYRLVRGYNRRSRIEGYNTASILAAIYNTIPRKKGSKPYKAEDFMRSDEPEPKQSGPIDIEERKRLAQEALNGIDRFNKGVVKKVY